MVRHDAGHLPPASANGGGKSSPFFQSLRRQVVEDEGGKVALVARKLAGLSVGGKEDAFERQAERAAHLARWMPESEVAGDLERIRDSRWVAGENGSLTPLYLRDLCRQERDAQGEERVEESGDEKPGRVAAWSSGQDGGDVVQSSVGNTLPQPIEARVGALLGVDLGHVKVHDDDAANLAARLMNARAFTHRNHIYLAKGQSANDMGLLAHEVAHVVQQGAAGRREGGPPNQAGDGRS